MPARGESLVILGMLQCTQETSGCKDLNDEPVSSREGAGHLLLNQCEFSLFAHDLCLCKTAQLKVSFFPMTVSLYWPHTGPDGCSRGAWLICGRTGIVLFLPMFGKMLWPLKPSAPRILISRSSKTPGQHTSRKDGPLYGGCFRASVQVFYTTVIFPVIKTLTYFQLAGKQPNLQALEVHYHIPGCTRQRKP